MSIKKGTTVEQIMPVPFRGKVAAYSVDGETGEVQVLVEHTCSEGHVHSRYFKADQVKEIEATDEPTLTPHVHTEE